MTPSSTTDSAADDEQAAGSETEDAPASEEKTGKSSESKREAETGDDTPGETPATTDDADEGTGGTPPETERSGLASVIAGAAAVVGAGLGLASLTGTWLSDQMATRQSVIGQVSGQATTTSEQVAAIYGTPAHTTALFNGFFAVAAIIVSAVALIIPAVSKAMRGGNSSTWVRAVACAGLVFGTIGLVIAAVMWFDVFTQTITVPEPTMPQGPVPPG